MADYHRKPTVLLRLPDQRDLFRGVIEECERLGWRSINLFYMANYVPDCDNIMGAVVGSAPKVVHDRIGALRVPIVFLKDLDHLDLSDTYRVFLDRHSAGVLAADAFAERGFRHLGYINFKSEQRDPLLKGFFRHGKENTCETHFYQADVANEFPDRTERFQRQLESIAEWLKTCPTPIGILSYNEYMGVKIIAACEMAGKSVPEQIAVVSRNNDEAQCKTAPVPLSAIDMNQEEQGRLAVQLLQRISEGQAPPKEVIRVPVKGFVERRSTDILAVPDPRVAQAIRFMWDHLSWPMNVDDVALEVGTSRNTLERAFRRCLGRGVNAELRRKRLEHCRELLRTTDKPLAEIAKAVGLKSRLYLHRSFKAAFDMTPQEYRRSHAPKAK